MKVSIDFDYVPTNQADMDKRLINWARWVSASLRAFNASPEGLKSIARRAAKNTGKIRAPEVRAKMSISARNRSPVSEATRTLMRIAASSRPPQSAETIAKRVAKNTGKTRTAEQRANLRAGQQLRYT